ncbi:MAG: nucleotidyltransferase domain-containing protein [candidate division Zixibacteria bacterium]|nr:nucleotidyltransferase domain-containing protein [candidate division Zixibacteria bacterium]
MKKIKDKNLERILGEINTLLDKFLNQQYKLILFGSRARGEEEEFSDVDLMVILEDEISNFQTKEKIRDTIYDFSLKSPYLFSVIIASKSLAQKRKGFLVFDSIEKEGIVIGA